jgi:microcystin-dependent protein
VSVDGHAITEAEMPSHSHGILGTNSTGGVVDENFHGGNMNGVPAVYNAGGTESHRSASSAGNPLTEAKGSGSAHTHTAAAVSDGAHTHSLSSISILPTYKQLYFIMKVS